jgi:hypothetical protein
LVGVGVGKQLIPSRVGEEWEQVGPRGLGWELEGGGGPASGWGKVLGLRSAAGF